MLAANEFEPILANWGIKAETITPLSPRENQIFRVDADGRCYALKIARANYQSLDALQCELALLAHLAKENFPATSPVSGQGGGYLFETGMGVASLYAWIDGVPFAKLGTPLSKDESAFGTLGHMLARFHDLTENWTHPALSSRPNWDRNGLVGDAPFWGRFWENPILTKDEQARLLAFRTMASAKLPNTKARVIHADLVGENIMVENDKFIFIDFDDFGLGYPQFDIATALLKYDHLPNYPALQGAFLEGYQSVRAIDLAEFELFMAVRACTYLGWIMARPELDENQERSKRFRDHALRQLDSLGV